MKVDCNGCGASLTVAETTRFATCVKCSARLEIRRSDGALYTEVLADAAAEEAASQSTPSVVVVPAAASSSSESLLRVVVGVVLLASDLFWWMTDPTMQSLYVRLALLAAGAWLVLSGVWRAIESGRARVRAHAAAKKLRTPGE